jgi:hypothetical protein
MRLHGHMQASTDIARTMASQDRSITDTFERERGRLRGFTRRYVPNLADAEDIVEVSMVIPEGRTPRWATFAAEETGVLAIPSGSYRLRVSAWGRDAGEQGEFADGIVDRYLLQLWPADPAPDSILRTGSGDATYWHGTWGSRR